MIDLFHFTDDDIGELTSDHVFIWHREKRNKLISELYDLSPSITESHLNEIEYEDDFLMEFIKAREIYVIAITDEMKKYKPFDIQKFKDTLLTEDNLDDALWALAEECRDWKKKGYFTTFRSAYNHGAKQLTKIGRSTTLEKLENAYSKYKTEGRKENLS